MKYVMKLFQFFLSFIDRSAFFDLHVKELFEWQLIEFNHLFFRCLI